MADCDERDAENYATDCLLLFCSIEDEHPLRGAIIQLGSYQEFGIGREFYPVQILRVTQYREKLLAGR